MESAYRIYKLDNLKVIMMLLVIVTHSIIPYQFNNEKWVPYAWIILMTYTMPVFMVISGFLYKERKFTICVRRFLIPCIIFSLLNSYIGGGIPLYTEKVGAGYLKIGYTMWYIWALFLYNMVIPVIMKKMGWKWMVTLGMSTVIIFNIIPFPNGVFQLCRVVNFFPFFLLGMYIRKNSSILPITKVNADAIIIASLIFLGCLIIYVVAVMFYPSIVFDTGMTVNPGTSLNAWIIRGFTYVFNAVMAVSLILFFPDKELFFTRLSARTINVYMLHMSVIFIIGWSVLPLIINEWYGYVYSILIVPVVCILLFAQSVNTIMSKLLSGDLFSNLYKKYLIR